jgi:hypothetical protein
MQRQRRVRAFWIALVGAVILSAVIVPLWVTADSGEISFTATLYSDVIRFEAGGVASLRVTIYDLSENELWSSGLVMGDFVDWDRANARGERLANGYYLYLAQGWDGSDTLILSKAGKVVLLPGDQVQLQAAPIPLPSAGDSGRIEAPLQPMAQVFNDDIHLVKSGALFLIRTTDDSAWPQLWFRNAANVLKGAFTYKSSTDVFTLRKMAADGAANERTKLELYDSKIALLGGNVGVGTDNPTDVLTIEGASGNLIACYPSSSRAAGAAVFRVESDGDVYADGTAYAANFVTGSADVAERINVSEWVEAGDVVEIDPDHVGFFRKATGLYSRRVAGIISTSPGVILGNDFDSTADHWDDARPVLAIAGRVPVKASTENGPIAVGDLLVSSSDPGIAMKGDPAASIGAVVGKAMEPLQEGEGTIMAQVTLR